MVGRHKSAAISKVISEKCPDFVCLVETKHAVLVERRVAAWWNGVYVGWDHVEAQERLVG